MSRKIIFFLIATLVCLAGMPRSVEGQTKDQLAEQGAKSLESLDKPQFLTSRCHLGITVYRKEQAGGVYVFNTFPSYATYGLQSDDRILRINGQGVPQLDEFSAMFLDIGPDETVVVDVERDSTERTLEIQCVDALPIYDQLRALATAMKKKQFKKCESIASETLRTQGVTFQSYGVWFSCANLSGQFNRYDQHQQVYELQRLRIKEAQRTGPKAMEGLRGSVITTITWLEENGGRRFARELEQLLERRSYGISSAGVGGGPAPGTVGYGTCFAVSPDGLILTSHHVVSNAKRITIYFDGLAKQTATIEGSSQATDLVVLKVTEAPTAYLPLAPLRSATVGEDVFTYGFPASTILGKEPKFTDGVISSLTGLRDEATFMQISVPIQPGNSGGPVVNDAGEVVGIVAATAAVEVFYDAVGTLPQNVNWAIKADYARPLLMPSEPLEPAAGRKEAIDRTRGALCQVEVLM